MEMQYPNTPQETAALDQMETALVNMGKLMGAYYLSLRKEGIPKPLAFELVVEYHGFTLARMDSNDG